MEDDPIDLSDAADTLRAYEEQRAKREQLRSIESQDQWATRQAQAAAGAPLHEMLRRPPY